MTTPAPTRRSIPAILTALAAAVVGVAVLVLAVFRIIDLVAAGPAEPPVSVATTGTVAAATTSTTAPIEFFTITDDRGALSADIPVRWADVSGAAWVVDGTAVGLTLAAAPDLEAWYSTWGTPGAFIGVSGTFVPETDDFSEACVRGNTAPRTAGLLDGTVQAWSDCGEEGSDFYVFAGGTIDGTGEVLIHLVSIDDSGLDVLTTIMTTLRYTPYSERGGR